MDDFRARYHADDSLFLPNSWDHYRGVSGNIYAAPFAWGPRAMFYRTDILAEHGFDGPPTTWDELLEMGAVIGNGVDRFALAPLDAWLNFHFFSSIIYSTGGLIVDETGSYATTNTPEALRAWEIYTELYNQNVIPSNPALRADAFAGFVEGYYAMVHTGTWWFGLLSAQAPELEGYWSVGLLPSDVTTYSFGHCNPWIIPVNPANPDVANPAAAEAWLNFLLVPEHAVHLHQYFGQLPPMLAAYDDPILADNPHIMTFMEILARGVNSLRADNAEPISETIWTLLEDLRDGVVTPQEAAELSEERINSILGN